MAIASTTAEIFPLILPISEDGSAFEGFVTLPNAESFRTSLWLRLTDIPGHDQKSLLGAQLECSPELTDLLDVRS